MILNLNNETDFTDLFGGFKPVSIYKICQSVIKHFMILSKKTFNLINELTYEKKIKQVKLILNLIFE